MRNKVAIFLQLLGLVLFISGTVMSKNGNVIPFIIGCLTGLKPSSIR